MPVFVNIKNPISKEKLKELGISWFTRRKKPYQSYKEELQQKIRSLEFKIDDYKFKLFGDDPDDSIYRETDSLGHQVIIARLNDAKVKLKELKQKLLDANEDYDINEDYNSKIEKLKEYDGVINKDFEILIPSSNQLKSAINNNGNFSKTDNNIYHSLYYSDMIPYVIPFLRDSGIAHMWGGKLRLTKYNPAAKLQLENFCNTYGLYADIKDDGVIELYETDDKDEIREHVQDMKEVNQIIRFLQ